MGAQLVRKIKAAIFKKLTIDKQGWIEPYEGVCPGADTATIDLEDERNLFKYIVKIKLEGCKRIQYDLASLEK